MSQPCVIARLAGGLGNQLFMYAFNKAMAQRNKVPLKLDVMGGFMRDKTYQRTHLAGPYSPAGAGRQSLGKPPVSTRRERSGDSTASSMRMLPLERRYYVHERTMSFDPEIRNLKIVRPTDFHRLLAVAPLLR